MRPAGPLSLFACFDPAHDADLHAVLARQCLAPGSMISLVDWSRDEQPHAEWEDRLRARMARVDAMVVICGEHTESAANVSRELGILQEQGKPYVLLWGRRASSCTRPAGARSDDCFYTWIWEILSAQIQLAVRKSDARH
jgi:hypothetical protein